MNMLRDNLLMGISWLDWLTGIGIGVATVAGLWGLREAMVKRLQGAAGTDTWVDDLFLLLARRTSRVYMVAMGLAAAALYETSERELPTWLRVFMVGALCLQVLRWANAGVDFWVHRMHRNADGTQSSRASLAIVGMVIRALVFVLVVVLALDNFGVNVTALVTGLGITGIAVALAVQNILGDLLAALAITFDKPFVVGDEITVNDISGKVEKIGLKTTRLRVASGEQVSIANAEVLKTRLTNVSRTETRMLPLTVGIAANGLSGDALLTLARQCETAATSVPGVRAAKARAWAIVDGRARINVESVLDTPQSLATVRPLLIAALTDAASTPERPVLGIS
jgi:small-conductance mechanosensitive channel